LTQSKKYHPSGNLKFNYLGIFQSLKLRISMEKILLISPKQNFTPNTLGGYGLSLHPKYEPISLLISLQKSIEKNRSSFMFGECIDALAGG